MKKLIAFTLSLVAIALIVVPAKANALESSLSPTATYAPHVRVQIGRDWRYNHRVRVVTRTQIVRIRGRVFRETYQVRYLPNGRTQTILISRVRIR